MASYYSITQRKVAENNDESHHSPTGDAECRLATLTVPYSSSENPAT